MSKALRCWVGLHKWRLLDLQYIDFWYGGHEITECRLCGKSEYHHLWLKEYFNAVHYWSWVNDVEPFLKNYLARERERSVSPTHNNHD